MKTEIEILKDGLEDEAEKNCPGSRTKQKKEKQKDKKIRGLA